MAAIQDEFFSLSQAKIIQTFAGDLDGFVKLLGKSYEMLGDALNLDGVEKINVTANNVTITDTNQGGGAEVGLNKAAIAEGFSTAPGKMLGGATQGGDVRLVGEQGPEMIRFGRSGEVINNASTNDIMSAAGSVMNNIGNNNANYSQQTLDVLTAMAKDQADTKRLLQKILPKSMTSNGYF